MTPTLAFWSLTANVFSESTVFIRPQDTIVPPFLCLQPAPLHAISTEDCRLSLYLIRSQVRMLSRLELFHCPPGTFCRSNPENLRGHLGHHVPKYFCTRQQILRMPLETIAMLQMLHIPNEQTIKHSLIITEVMLFGPELVFAGTQLMLNLAREQLGNHTLRTLLLIH